MKTTEIITAQEASRRKVLEKTITKGIGTVLKVGEALTEIKESRLYRDKFKTFAEYCDKKWGFTRMRAHQLIEASNVHAELPKECKTSFTNAKQLNALATLPKSERAEAAKAIIEKVKKTGGKITAAAILPKPATSPMRGVDPVKLDAPEPEAEWQEPPAPEAVQAEPLPNPVLLTVTEPEHAPVSRSDQLKEIPGEREERKFEGGANLPDVLTPKLFQDALHELEQRIPVDTCKDFAKVASRLAARLDPNVAAPMQERYDFGPLNPKVFTKQLAALEAGAESAADGNQKEREKYGVIVNALAGRLLNPVKKEFNPYTS
jgi:hypothetical protein